MDVFKQISGRKGAVESRFFLPYVLFPRYLQLFFLLCTIRKIQVDECLVWNAGIFALLFKKVNRVIVNINCYLFL